MKCLGNKSLSSVLSVEELIIFYKKHQCCKDNCAVSICGLPDNKANFCTDCYSSSSKCCNYSETVGSNELSDVEKKKLFYEIVEANRAKFIRYFATKSDCIHNY